MKDKEKAKNKKKKQALDNQKHRNNKILKAKEILAKNKAALEKAAEKKKVEAAKRPLPIRILVTIKKVFFGVLIAALALILIAFFIIRINGGTPDVFGYSIQRVVSGSMEPELRVGDIILSKNVTAPEELHVNDIITFQGGDEYDNNMVTHRVIAPPACTIDGEWLLTTKGDANERPDDEINFDTVKSKMVIKIDAMNKFYEFFLSPWGLIVFIAALLIIFFDELLTVVKVITGNYDDDEEEEDESVGEIMERLKREEEEQRLEEERKRLRRKKNQNTSKKKLKRWSEKKAEKKPKNTQKAKKSAQKSSKHANKKHAKKKK